ncbi:MAG TPA: LPS export ABC transporter periplasmic protein LptC [Usitatibacteraceae bacterium]|nr:LPS export ABC transporter periplasmic protein LptC [Usitatibacteraceae bacterium]
MFSRSFSLLPLTVLALLAALSVWLSYYVQASGAGPDRKARHEPDVIVDNFSAKKLDTQGEVQFAVNARQLLHYADDDSSEMSGASFEAFRKDHPPLNASAPQGRLVRGKDGKDEVVLSGGVTVESVAQGRFAALHLTTPRLVVLPEEQLARSTDGVILTSADARIVAKTFEISADSRKIKLGQGEATFNRRP